MLDEDKINNLWKWFYHNEGRVRECMEGSSESEEEIVDRLNNLVLELGHFTWEIGKGTSKSWSFSLSPNGDHDLFPLSKSIIEIAPQLSEWEFYSTKQAKEWDRFFLMYDTALQQHEIDAKDWQFAAFSLEDNTIEIIIKAPTIAHLDKESQQQAVDIVVLHEIGEEKMIVDIDDVNVVAEFEEEDFEKVRSIADMKVTIEGLLA